MGYLEMREVSFSYPNGYEAIKEVNLNFGLGESVAIIGQNGSGKTTTVKLMNGLLKPSKGEVIVDNVSTKEKTTAMISQKVGYVFQNPDDQIFQKTIYKEIAYGLVHKKLTKEQIDVKVRESAKMCGLSDVLEEHPYNLPYSKRKFVTIAAIVAMDTEIIILDEPTAGQDSRSTELLAELISQLSCEGKTVITITHDMEFVAQHFRRVIVFADKEMRRDGTPEEIFWDEPLLRLANLKQPYVCQLAKIMGYQGIMTTQDLLERKFNLYERYMD